MRRGMVGLVSVLLASACGGGDGATATPGSATGTPTLATASPQTATTPTTPRPVGPPCYGLVQVDKPPDWAGGFGLGSFASNVGCEIDGGVLLVSKGGVPQGFAYLDDCDRPESGGIPDELSLTLDGEIVTCVEPAGDGTLRHGYVTAWMPTATPTPVPTPVPTPTPKPTPQPTLALRVTEDDLMAACTGTPIPHAAKYAGTVHPLAVVGRGQWYREPSVSYGDGGYDINIKWIDDLWVSPIQLVVCVDDAKSVKVGSCGSYTRASDGAVGQIIRYKYTQKVRVVVARTGKELQYKTLAGSTPQCAANLSIPASGPPPWKYYGDYPSVAAINSYATSVSTQKVK